MNKRPRSWIIPIILIAIALVTVIIAGYVVSNAPPTEHTGIEPLTVEGTGTIEVPPIRAEMPEIIIRTFVPDLPCENIQMDENKIECCASCKYATMDGPYVFKGDLICACANSDAYADYVLHGDYCGC